MLNYINHLKCNVPSVTYEIDASICSTRNDTLHSDASFLQAKLLTSIDEEEDMVVVDGEDCDDGDEDIDAALNAMSGDTIDSAINDTDSMTNEILSKYQNKKYQMKNQKQLKKNI